MRDYTSLGFLHIEDIVYIEQQIKENDSGFWRRTYIKTAVSHFEAMTYTIKKYFIEHCELKIVSIAIDPVVLMLLNDKKITISDSGTLKESNSQATLTSNIKFVFKQISDTLSFEFPRGLEESGWSNLTSTISVRNRLTHPKVFTEQAVTEREVLECNKALSWMHVNMTAFVEFKTSFLKEQIKTNNENLEQKE